MSHEPEWALLSSYSSSLEAELAIGALEGNGIPAQIRGLEVGIWGPGHAGRTVTGPAVWVPEDRLEEARELRLPVVELDDEPDESD
jgi:hypothetical protein